jgi:hypothetical protein
VRELMTRGVCCLTEIAEMKGIGRRASIGRCDCCSADSRCDCRYIHFNSPPHSDRAIVIELDRLNNSGEADNATGGVQGEQRYR